MVVEIKRSLFPGNKGVIVFGNEIIWEDTDITKSLKSAIQAHNTEALISILSDFSIVPPASMLRSADGKGALFWAYEFNFEEGVQILEKIGVDPSAKDAQGYTPSYYKNIQSKSKHIKSDNSIDWADTDITEKLFQACSRRDTDALITILGDTSIVPPASMMRSSDGRGPLFWAYEYGHTAGIRILEDIGADPNAKDALGKTPRQLGVENEERNRHHMSYAHSVSEVDYDDDVYDDDDDYDDFDSEF